MTLDTRIPLSVENPKIGEGIIALANIRQQGMDRRQQQVDANRQRTILDLQYSQAQKEAKEYDEAAPTRKLQALNEREEAKLKSVIPAAAQTATLLKNNNLDGAREFLTRRKAILEEVGIDSSDTAEALIALDKDPKGLLQSSEELVNFGIQQGIIKAPELKAPQTREIKRGDQIITEQFNPQTGQYEQIAESARFNPKAGTDVNVTVDNTDKAFASEFGKANAQQFFERRSVASDAANSLTANNEARNLMDKGVITGAGANIKLELGKALQAAGFNVAQDAVANTEAFIGQRAQEVGRIIKLFGAGTGLSDADREFARKAAAGDITYTQESILRLLDINDRAARNVIQAFNQDAGQIPAEMSPYPLTIDLPEIQLPQGVRSINEVK